MTRRTSTSQPSSASNQAAGRLGDLRLSEAISLLSQTGQIQLDGAAERDVQLVQRIIDGLCELSSLDALTGLVNVRPFRLALDQELDRVSRGGSPMALLMIDADHFKSINDTYGHVTGDIVLQAIAQCLRDNMRPMDTLARYGGEEFAAILPNCLPQHALRAAERFRKRVEAKEIVLRDGQIVQVTVSVGVVSVSTWRDSDAKTLIASADRQLYEAKRAGRNRVVMEPTSVTGVSASEKSALLSADTQAKDE